MSKMEVMDLRMVDHLISAKALIEKGWCQHDYEDAFGNVCMLGAIGQAEDHPLANKAEELLEECLPKWYLNKLKKRGEMVEVHEWNDRPSRKKQQVIAVFNKAIALATQRAMEKVHV
jgi:hypothetical protein